MPRARARVDRIERVADPARLQGFLRRCAGEGGGEGTDTDDVSGTGGVAGIAVDQWDQCEVGFHAPAELSRILRLKEVGFSDDDAEEVPGLGYGVPVALYADIAHAHSIASGAPVSGSAAGSVSVSAAIFSAEVLASGTAGGGAGMRCMCVVLCGPGAVEERRLCSDQWYCAIRPAELLMTHVVWYEPLIQEEAPAAEAVASAARLAAASTVPQGSGSAADGSCAASPAHARNGDGRQAAAEKRRHLARQQREYAKAADPLIKGALQSLDRAAAGTTGTVLLLAASTEAESIVNLYLLGGGGAHLPRPPGVDLREALGGVVVQRILNQPLYQRYQEYCAEGRLAQAAERGADVLSPRAVGEQRGKRGLGAAPRLREDVVWHGTRLKRLDEGASLATKLQSIAEQGFDPQRCTKGAAAEGGIWVATSPLASFGHGCDGLVAFILCVAKTNFNEWVDATCARVLVRERVLPLYSLVHA